MKSYRIAICDDEPEQSSALREIVDGWGRMTGAECRVSVFPSAEAFRFAYEDDSAYDILLLDVEMKGMTGIELARRLRAEGCRAEIVFITSHFEFVGEGYEVDALHYLQKPVSTGAEYDSDRVRDCLAKAGFGERLDSLPDGLDTPLYKEYSKDGVEISGGEAQKIALARALYKNAPFIVLDEPTAALDPVSEYEVYSNFNRISGGKTAIYISHRLASCRFCDEILVFDGGSVVQHGTHEALLAESGGKYAELWVAQAQYYKE